MDGTGGDIEGSTRGPRGPKNSQEDKCGLGVTYLLGLAQFPICNFLYSQFPIPALFWPCCGMRLFTELGFSKFNLRKVFPLNSLFKFLHNGKYDN